MLKFEVVLGTSQHSTGERKLAPYSGGIPNTDTLLGTLAEIQLN